MSHTLYISHANADQVFEFLTQAESLFFNCRWHMSMPFDEVQTHNVYCELRKNDLAAVRDAIATISSEMGTAFECEIRPDRI